jgi:hypothetical protein
MVLVNDIPGRGGRVECPFAIDQETGDAHLARLGHQPIDESSAGCRPDMRLPVRVHKDDTIRILQSKYATIAIALLRVAPNALPRRPDESMARHSGFRPANHRG